MGGCVERVRACVSRERAHDIGAMPKRRLFLVLIGGVVLVGVFVVIALGFRPAREPEYEGKKLSQWVDNFYQPSPEATKAIQHIRTEAIPFLLKWMRYEIPPWRATLCDKLNPLIARVQLRWVFDYKKLRILGDRSVNALIALEPDAGTVVELERMLNERPPGRAAQRAAQALGRLKKIEPLIALLTKRDTARPVSNWDGVRPYGPYVGVQDDGSLYSAVAAIGRMGTNARPAMPVLMACLRDKDPLVVMSAIEAIEGLEFWGVVEPGLAVPALTNCLHHPIAKIRASAVTLLGHFWWGYKEGRLAMPALRAAAGDPDSVVHAAATNVLWEIGLQGERAGGH